MTWGQEVCIISLHSEPASELSLPTVWSLWGNLGVARCQEILTLPAGYIPQCKATWGSMVTISNQLVNLVRPSVNRRLWWYPPRGGNINMERPKTFLESRSWWGNDCGKQIINSTSYNSRIVVILIPAPKVLLWCADKGSSFNSSQPTSVILILVSKREANCQCTPDTSPPPTFFCTTHRIWRYVKLNF